MQPALDSPENPILTVPNLCFICARFSDVGLDTQYHALLHMMIYETVFLKSQNQQLYVTRSEDFSFSKFMLGREPDFPPESKMASTKVYSK